MATLSSPGRSLGAADQVLDTDAVAADEVKQYTRELSSSEGQRALLWLPPGVALLLLGMASSDVLSQIPWPRTAELALAGLLLWLLPTVGALLWTRARNRLLLGALGLLALLLHGPVALLAVGMLALLALATGSLLGAPLAARPLLTLVCGLAVLSALAGWTLPWPLPLPALLAVAIAVAGASLWRQRSQLQQALRGLDGELSRPSSFWPLWLAGLGLLASGTPSLQFDDLAYHLALPAQLQQYGHARLDAWTQLWSLAPWAGDALQGWAAVLAGGEVRGALNLLWWLLLWGGLAEACRGLLPVGVASRAILLGASLPLGWVLLGGMQTELPAAATLVALVGWLWRPGAGSARRDGLVGGVLTGLLLGLKVSHLALIGPLLLLALLRSPRQLLAWLPTAVPATLLVGGSSYAYAAWISGNPVLPLFNGWFAAPQLAPVSIRDARYADGLDLGDAFGLWFDSSRYYESWDGVAGWQFVLLAGPLLLGLWRWSACPRQPGALLGVRGAILSVLLGALLLFAQMQYLRYLYPALVLAGVAIAMGLHWLSQPAARAVMGLAVALNLLFLANAHWLLRESLWPAGLHGSASRSAWKDQHAPERRLIDIAHALDAQATILLADPAFPYHADARGRTLSTTWYDSQLQQAAAACSEAADCWQQLWSDHGISHLIVREPATPVLQTALEGSAQALRTLGPATLYAIEQPWQRAQWAADSEPWQPQLSTDGAWLLQLSLELPCTAGQPLLLRNGDQLLHYAHCPDQGSLGTRLSLSLAGGEAPPRISAEGVATDALVQIDWRLRRDLPAERQATLPALLQAARR